MSSGGRGGHRGGGGKDGGRASGGDRQSSNRGRSRSSRSGRNHRGPKQSTITTATSAAGASGTASLPSAENSLPSLPSPPPPPAAAMPMAVERRDDGLVPGAGLLALQALAAAQKKNTGEGGTVGGAIPAAVAEAAEKAVAGSGTEGPKGRGRGGKSRGKVRGGGGGSDGSGGSGGGRAGGSGGGGSSSRDMGSIKGRGSASLGARGGGVAAAMAAAAISAAAKPASSSRSRGGKGGAGDATGWSTKSGNGVKKDFTEDPGKRQLSEAEQRKREEKASKALAAQQEQRKQAEEDRRRKAEEDRKVREEQRARRELEDKERQRRAEVDARRRELEEKKALEARKRLEEKRRKAEEQKIKAEEEARKKIEEAKRKEEEEKREEERLRLEEARALEEEKRQKEAEEERARREFEAQMEAVSQLDLLHKEEQSRRELRAKHTPEALNASREAHEASKSKLKSDLKRTTAFTKKVKTLSEEQRSSLTKEVEGLNLSRYVSEVADAVAENRLKSADIPVAVHLCCLMHQRYGDFADDLIPKLAAPLLSPGAEDEREEKENLRRKRSSLRLLTELHAAGVFDGTRLIGKIVQSLCGQDGKDKRRQRPAQSSGDLRRRDQPTVTAAPHPLREGDLVLLTAFVRTAGEDMLGVLQRKTVNFLKQAGEMGKLERESILDADVKTRLRSLVEVVFDSLCVHLEKGHEQLGRLEKKMERDRLTNGSLTDEKEKNLDESRKAYEALFGNVSSLAASLNKDMPQLPEEEEEEGTGGISLWEGGVMGDKSEYTGPFEESERSFYEDLPDLLNTYPPNLLGLTEEQAEQLREEERAKQRERIASASLEGEGGLDTEGGGDENDIVIEGIKGVSLEEGGEEGRGDGMGEKDGEGEGGGGGGGEEEGGVGGGITGEGEGDGDDAEEGGGDSMTRNARLTLMLEDELPNCHNQERVDEFAKNFCYVNSKGARKKLVVALFSVPRQALDLLPMYARLVAILDKAMKTIAPALLDELKNQFRYYLRKKAPGQIDHRFKNVRYIGELVKFRVAAPVVAFQCLKACLNDFSSGAVQAMCALLETCGRFLFRQKLTHQRMRNFLSVMMKIKKAKNLDNRLEALIDNAFYTCCPPERQKKAVKVRTPLQLYIRYLMMEKLTDDPDVVEGVIKQLRKLPWQDPEAKVESEVLRASLRLCRSRYPCIHLAADVLSGLARHQDRVVVKVVDTLLEELHRGIELPGGGRDSQRLVGYACLLAELYNYAVVGSPSIFETLHLLLDSGHEVPAELKQPRPGDPKNPSKASVMPPMFPPWARFDPRIRSATDPPGDCLRIRLVVAILEGCGSYFVRGGGLARLSKFLSDFQRYLFCKERLPAGTEFAVLDLMEELESGARAARERDRAKFLRGSLEGKSKGRGRGGKEEESANNAVDDGPILPRHRTWEDAQAAVLEADRVWDEDNSRRMAKILKLLGKEKTDAGGDQEQEGEEDDDEEDDDEEDEEDDRRGSGSEGEEDCKAESEATEEDRAKTGPIKEGEGEAGVAEGAGDDVVLHKSRGVERTEEDGAADAEFEAMLSKTMSESVEKTKIARATTQVMGHMAVPMVLKNTNVKQATHQAPLTGGIGVAFKLLKRTNKGKMEAQEVMVPATTSLAAQVSRNEEANREENSIIKARVLAYEANMEEAMMAQEPGAVPLQEDYTQFIPKVHNAPLHAEGGKGNGKGGGSRGGGGGGGGGGRKR